MDRIECPKSGKIIDELQVLIPDDKREQAKSASHLMGEGIRECFCMCKGVKTVTEDLDELYLNNIWRSQLEVIGQDGIPSLSSSGNVLRPYTTLRCSLRLPPTIGAQDAFKIIKELLTKDPPYGAHVEVTDSGSGDGWNSNEISKQIIEILDRHNQEIFVTKRTVSGKQSWITFTNGIDPPHPSKSVFVPNIS